MATLARGHAYRQRVRRDGADDTPLAAAPGRALVWLAGTVAHPYGRTPRPAVDPGLFPGAPAALNPRAPWLAIQPRGQASAHHSQAQQIPEVRLAPEVKPDGRYILNRSLAQGARPPLMSPSQSLRNQL